MNVNYEASLLAVSAINEGYFPEILPNTTLYLDVATDSYTQAVSIHKS